MDVRTRFQELHDDGIFVMPNPWDVGSARMLAEMGFPALATTSSGHAAALGRLDQQLVRADVLAGAEAIASAVAVPVSVDSERCYGADAEEVAETVELLAETGAAGCSIEDYDPATGRIDGLDVAVARVAAAAQAAARHRLVLTARAENHLYGASDLADTITRLRAYREAGASVVYAPGLIQLDHIARVVDEVGGAVNVLLRPGGPTVEELGRVGVRRVSTGGALAWAAYGALERAAGELLRDGTPPSGEASLSPKLRDASLGS